MPVIKSIFTPEQKKLQALLRQLRVDAGLHQAELARFLGKPQSYVSKYEIGERCLGLLEIRQVCYVLGISLGEFVRRFEEMLIENDDKL